MKRRARARRLYLGCTVGKGAPAPCPPALFSIADFRACSVPREAGSSRGAVRWRRCFRQLAGELPAGSSTPAASRHERCPLAPSPACGGGRGGGATRGLPTCLAAAAAKAGASGDSVCGNTPTPTLPRKRERERSGASRDKCRTPEDANPGYGAGVVFDIWAGSARGLAAGWPDDARSGRSPGERSDTRDFAAVNPHVAGAHAG